MIGSAKAEEIEKDEDLFYSLAQFKSREAQLRKKKKDSAASLPGTIARKKRLLSECSSSETSKVRLGGIFFFLSFMSGKGEAVVPA